MSARSAVGATNRSDLFSARSDIQSTAREYKDQEDSGKQQDEMDNNPLQLEHMLGYAGSYRKTIVTSPCDENTFLKSLGSLVSIEKLDDPHSQVFLRGHDMPVRYELILLKVGFVLFCQIFNLIVCCVLQVCALAYSDSGSLIASGQVGTKNYKGCAAPIFLWHASTNRRLAVLRGLSVRVTLLAFSADENFLCGCDEVLYFEIFILF
jgi:hypothetical protein